MNLDIFDPAKNPNLNLYAQGVSAGIEAERTHWFAMLDAIFAAYRKALADPKVMIPTPLHMAIANAQRDVGEIRLAKEAADKAATENSYAEAMQRKDQTRRFEGHEDMPGLDLVGRCMRAGM